MDKLLKIREELAKIAKKLKNNVSNKSQKLSPKWKERFTYFWHAFKERKEVVLIGLLSIVLVTLIITLAVPQTKNNIIAKETESLVGNTFKQKDYVDLIPYNTIEDMIIKNESITIAIIDQKDKNYRTFETVLMDEKQGSKLEMPLYLYPLVNDKDNVKNYFRIKKGLTLIHFENKRETARKTLTDKEEIETYMFDYLKSLNAGKTAMTATELEKSKVQAGKEAKGEETDKKNSDIIDELKDIII